MPPKGAQTIHGRWRKPHDDGIRYDAKTLIDRFGDAGAGQRLAMQFMKEFQAAQHDPTFGALAKKRPKRGSESNFPAIARRIM